MEMELAFLTGILVGSMIVLAITITVLRINDG